MEYAKEIITIDVYGDTAEIIEDCIDDLQPFIDEVLPKKMKGVKLGQWHSKSSTHMSALMESLYKMVCEWAPDTVAYDPDALHFIDETEEMMKKWGVPLPASENVQFLIAQKDFSLGKPFEGLRLSYLSKNCK